MTEKIAEDPGNKDLHATKAGLLIKLKRYAEAIKCADEAIAASSEDEKGTWGWGHFRKGDASLRMGDYLNAVRGFTAAAKAEPGNAKFHAMKEESLRIAKEKLDPLDWMTIEMEKAAAADLEESNEKEKRRAEEMKGKKIDIDENKVDLGFQFNPAAHCYICKQRGHTKRDCPMRKCDYCYQIGHKRSDCPMLTEDIERAKEEERLKKRKEQYEAKKQKKKDEWTELLRKKTGIDGHGPLYQILDLPERKLATEAEIKAAYKKKALQYHPDKNRNAENPEEIQQRFLEAKAAYDLLMEAIRTGTVSAESVQAASSVPRSVEEEKKARADAAFSAALSTSMNRQSLNERAQALARGFKPPPKPKGDYNSTLSATEG